MGLIIFVSLVVLASESRSQSLPWSFGFCTIPPFLRDFNASAYFTGKWYQQSSYGDFFSKGVGICPTIDNEITQNGEIRQKYYSYQQLTMSYSTIDGTAKVSDIQNGQGYVAITYDILNGILPYKAPIYIVGTDYDNWAVIFSCRQQLFLKLEMSWTLTRVRDGAAYSNIINQTIVNAGLDANKFVTSTNVGCGPDEPSL